MTREEKLRELVLAYMEENGSIVLDYACKHCPKRMDGECPLSDDEHCSMTDSEMLDIYLESYDCGENVPEKINALLQEKGMSKLQLSLKAGINPPDLYAALNGTKPMYPKYKTRISKVLGVSGAELFE